MPQKNHSLFILGITAISTLGGFLFGYDTGVIGGSQLYFTEYFRFTSVQQGWAVSSALYGCLLGAIIAGWLSERFGRKFSLILSAFLFSISAWGSGIPETLDILVVFRLIGGLGVGIASMTAPMYIAEIAPPAQRGRLVSYYQLAIVLGFFIVFVVTYLIGGGNTTGLSPEELESIHIYNVERGWRVMFWSELIPSSLFLIMLFFVPKSPRWLMLKGREEQALRVIRKVTKGENEAQKELEEIRVSIKRDRESEKARLFSGKMLFVLLLGIGLSVFQQVTGINAILYYGAEIFSKTLGYGPEDALKQQVLLGAVNMIFTFVAIFTVDRWGRKPLLITGTIGMFLGISTLALSVYFQKLGLISLLGMLSFIAAFALSMGPVVWVMLSEIFPNKIRSRALSIAVAFQWFSNAVVANVFPVLVNSKINDTAFNGALPYVIFGVLCLVTVVFVWRLIPETKGKSLEELEEIW
jgi:SP family xylose:H+ symportor-like MFS transporter